MYKRAAWLAAIMLLAANSVFATNPPPVQWERQFASYDTWVVHMSETHDSGLVAAGMATDTSMELSKLYLLRMDGHGNTLWQKTLSMRSQTGSGFAGLVQQTRDGGFIVSGGESARTFVLKTDSLGNQLWKTAAGFERGRTGAYVEQTQDGGYVFMRTGFRHDSLFLLKLDSPGSVVWRRSWKAALRRGYEWISPSLELHQTSDGGYVIAADSLRRTDSLGNRLWSRKYSDVWMLHSVQETPDHGFVATGTARAPWPLGYTKPYNMVLLKANSSGVLQWMRVFTDGKASKGNCVALTRDGGFLLAGTVQGGNVRGRVVRTDPQGNPIWVKTLDEPSELDQVLQTSDGGYLLNEGDIYFCKLAPEE